MSYDFSAVPEARIPSASVPLFQHILDTYASETNKVISVWRRFNDADLSFRPHPRSQAVVEIFKHRSDLQQVSPERKSFSLRASRLFFANFAVTSFSYLP